MEANIKDQQDYSAVATSYKNISDQNIHITSASLKQNFIETNQPMSLTQNDVEVDISKSPHPVLQQQISLEIYPENLFPKGYPEGFLSDFVKEMGHENVSANKARRQANLNQRKAEMAQLKDKF